MNIYRARRRRSEAVAALDAEFACPDWVFGYSHVTASRRTDRSSRSAGAAAATGSIGSGRRRARSPRSPVAVHRDERPRDRRRPGRPARRIADEPGRDPRARSRATAPGRRCVGRRTTRLRSRRHLGARTRSSSRRPAAGPAFGLFYPPRNRSFAGPAGELPPLIVTSHGGPTAAAYAAFIVGTQLFTSRGFAVLDVDYGGSTGYGRDYRKRLEGEWGVVDVDDCVNGRRWLAERGLVDGERLAIRGGSASGYTTLCAITFRDTFKAGTSYFGIGDLETFETETHKFESRYTRQPGRAVPGAARPVPRALAAQLHRPDLVPACSILQGAEDRVVPPAQARADRRRPLREAASRTPTCCSRARTTASGRPRTSSARSRPSCRSTARSSGSAGRRDRADRGPVPRAARGGVGRRVTRLRRRPRPPRQGSNGAIGPSSCCSSPRPRWRSSRGAIGIPYPILLVLGGLALGFVPGLPRDRARAGHRVPALPAADPVRGRLLHFDPRLQGEPAGIGLLVGRARPGDDRRRRPSSRMP